jgi:hypothetical protein
MPPKNSLALWRSLYPGSRSGIGSHSKAHIAPCHPVTSVAPIRIDCQVLKSRKQCVLGKSLRTAQMPTDLHQSITYDDHCTAANRKVVQHISHSEETCWYWQMFIVSSHLISSHLHSNFWLIRTRVDMSKQESTSVTNPDEYSSLYEHHNSLEYTECYQLLGARGEFGQNWSPCQPWPW